jgi:hypothetical protein
MNNKIQPFFTPLQILKLQHEKFPEKHNIFSNPGLLALVDSIRGC